MEYTVSNSFLITGRGTGLFFEEDEAVLPEQFQMTIWVTRPDGQTERYEAQREFAREVPPGEVMALVVPETLPKHIPVGSRVQIIVG